MHAGGDLERGRGALGLSLEDMADRTKISVERLSAIERQDLDALPPLIYTIGFVRAYARELSLDPDDLVRRYVSELDERTTLGEFASEDAPEPGPVTDVIASSGARALSSSLTKSNDRPWRPAQFLSDEADRKELAEDRTRVAPFHHPLGPPFEQPFSVAMTLEPLRPDWRAALPLVLGLVLLVTVAGVVGFIAGSRSDQSRGVYSAETDAVPSGTPSVEEATTSPVDDAVRVGNPDTPVKTVNDNAASMDFNGAWTFTNRVESTSYAAFKDLTLGYHVRLHHRGDRVWGAGFKTTENGRIVARPGRTPIFLEGTVDRGILELQFTEQGARRSTGGKFVLNVKEDGSLGGTFSSAAANSSGESRARRNDP